MHHHPTKHERAISLSILLLSWPGEFPRVESNYLETSRSKKGHFLPISNVDLRYLYWVRAPVPDTLSGGSSTYLKESLKKKRENPRHLTARYDGHCSSPSRVNRLATGLAFYSFPRSRLSCRLPLTPTVWQDRLAGIIRGFFFSDCIFFYCFLFLVLPTKFHLQQQREDHAVVSCSFRPPCFWLKTTKLNTIRTSNPTIATYILNYCFFLSRRLHSWWCPSVNSFKFQPCDHTPPRTQRLWFLIRCRWCHKSDVHRSLVGIVYG